MRLEPILTSLRALRTMSPSAQNRPIKLSVDTRHAETAVRALKLGADWINDVTGLNSLTMKKAVADSNAEVVIMHSITVPPQSDQTIPLDQDPVSALMQWGERKIEELGEIGIGRERIILDPGIGFGKTVEQTWEVLRSIRCLHDLGVRILVGHSRKSFLKSVTNHRSAERDIETATLSLGLAAQGVDFLRVHNVAMHSRCLKTWSQLDGIAELSRNRSKN